MKKTYDKYKIILIMIFIFAILIRMLFVYKTNISEYQFDFGAGNIETEDDYSKLYTEFDLEEHEGRHINYIMHLYKYNSLPNKIIGQFYHPPLHHFIMASWLKVMDKVSDLDSFKLESMQVLTLVYSIVILISLYAILKEFEIKDKFKIIPMLLFSFYPLYIFQSGSLNNDELVIMFSILAFLYTLKWNKNPNMKNCILLATFLGLGMMTKTSAIVMLIPAVWVYFKILKKYVDEDKKIINLIWQLLIFIIIFGILGFWFQFRELINGLNTIGIIQPFESLRIPTDNVWYRFGITNIMQMNSYNVWNYLIYSSLNFGIVTETTVLVKVMAVLVLILICNVLYYWLTNFKDFELINVALICWWISYFYLQISMPYTCSMHSRYMIVPISLEIIILGKSLEKEKNKLLKAQIYTVTAMLVIISVLSFII